MTALKAPMTPAKDWFSAKELAGLPGLPGTERGVHKRAAQENWTHRQVKAAGGPQGLQWEYALASLPAAAQAALLMRGAKARTDAPATEGPAKDGGHQSPSSAVRSREAPANWQRYERLPEKTKAEADRRLRALDAVTRLVEAGMPWMDAYGKIAAELGEHPATVRRWRAAVKQVPRADWLPALAPRYLGRTATAACSPEAWDVFVRDYLRLEAPALQACYDRLLRIAEGKGWTIPSLRTLQRRLRKTVPREVVVLERHGRDALERLRMPQIRDVSELHALHSITGDGHQFDLFVRWPGGEIDRPLGLFWQCIYARKILGWRVDRTENAELVRLSLKDVVERFGIPYRAYLDNGRAFASKHITGGVESRYRFKVKPEDPQGVLTALGVEVHWTKPYHGQSKPVERAFRDLCERVAKHPAFSGAYTGNKPDAKPEDYRSRAIPLDDFLRKLESEINEFNRHPGRRTQVCNGVLSYDQAFAESYADAPIRKATAEQLRMLMLAADTVQAVKPSGRIRLWDNFYWDDWMPRHAGERLTARFDPERLHEAIHVYSLDGRYLGAAPCRQAFGFGDVAAGKEEAKAKANLRKRTRELREAHLRLEKAQLAKMLPDVPTPPLPAANVIAPLFGQAVRPDPTQEETDEVFGRAVKQMFGE